MSSKSFLTQPVWISSKFGTLEVRCRLLRLRCSRNLQLWAPLHRCFVQALYCNKDYLAALKTNNKRTYLHTRIEFTFSKEIVNIGSDEAFSRVQGGNCARLQFNGIYAIPKRRTKISAQCSHSYPYESDKSEIRSTLHPSPHQTSIFILYNSLK